VIKFESCQKSRRNLDVFWLSQIFGGGSSKSRTRVNTPASRHVLEKFREDTPTSPEVIDAHTLNFKTNFKFSQLKFLGDPRSSLGVR